MPQHLLNLAGAFALIVAAVLPGAAQAQFGQPDRSDPPQSDSEPPVRPSPASKSGGSERGSERQVKKVLTESQKRCRAENRCALDASVPCPPCA